MERTFLHVDMDAFFASVEQHDRPELRGRPVVVGAPPDKRGVVAAVSYEARRYGIRSAMPSREAGRRCPHAVFLPPNGRRYQEVSQQVFRILERFTPFVEPLSIDEGFMDVTGSRQLFGSGREIAVKVRAAIRGETGLTASVGVAPNKFLAKIASEMDKPDGLTVAPTAPGEIAAFLAPLPVTSLWGVGDVSGGLLQKAGIRTVGDLQAASESAVARIVGPRAADHLCRLARGEDDREIEMDREEKSISREYTFPEDCRDPERLRQVLLDLVDDVGRQLRAAGKYAALARLKLRWQGFKTITRQRALPRPSCDDFSLRTAAQELFREQELVQPVRLIGFGVSRLGDRPAGQLNLFADESRTVERREKLSRTVDTIRQRFGDKVIRRASR
jgi:DNA polymerase-4